MFSKPRFRSIDSKLAPGDLVVNKDSSVVAIIETPSCHAIFIESYDGKNVTLNAVKAFPRKREALDATDVLYRSLTEVRAGRVGRFENIDYSDTAVAYADFNKLWKERIKWYTSMEESTRPDVFRAQILSSGYIHVNDIEFQVGEAYKKAFHRLPDYEVLPSSRCSIM